MGNLSTSAAHVINMFGFHLSMRQSVKTPGRLLCSVPVVGITNTVIGDTEDDMTMLSSPMS